MNARCLILDIGGVLELTPRTGWLTRWDEHLGLPPGTADERLADVWEAGEIGTITENEVREQVAARLDLGPVDTESFLADLWDEYLGTPNTELIDYVAGLRPRCRLGILSNSFAGARELETAAYGFDRLVDEVVYSHETGRPQARPPGLRHHLRPAPSAARRLPVRRRLRPQRRGRPRRGDAGAPVRGQRRHDRADHRTSGPYSFGLTFDMFRNRNRRRVRIPWTLS